MRVTVYDTSGRAIFTDETGGSQLSWPLLATDGRFLPNGVYLYRAVVRDVSGKWTYLPIRKVLVLR